MKCTSSTNKNIEYRIIWFECVVKLEKTSSTYASRSSRLCVYVCVYVCVPRENCFWDLLESILQWLHVYSLRNSWHNKNAFEILYALWKKMQLNNFDDNHMRKFFFINLWILSYKKKPQITGNSVDFLFFICFSMHIRKPKKKKTWNKSRAIISLLHKQPVFDSLFHKFVCVANVDWGSKKDRNSNQN